MVVQESERIEQEDGTVGSVAMSPAHADVRDMQDRYGTPLWTYSCRLQRVVIFYNAL